MRAATVSPPARSTSTTACPCTATLAAITRSPATRSRGTLSPVSAFSSTATLPSTTMPSAGTRAPGYTTMRIPGASSRG